MLSRLWLKGAPQHSNSNVTNNNQEIMQKEREKSGIQYP